LFGDDSWWWKYLDCFCIVLKPDFLLKYTWKPIPILLVPKAELKKTLIEIEKYTSFSYQKSWFFFSIFNSNHFFKLLGDDSRWWNYLDGFWIVSKPDFLLKYTWKPVPVQLVPKLDLKKALIEIEKYTSFSYQKSWFFSYLRFQSLL